MTFEFRASSGSDARSCAQIICNWGEETSWMVPIDDLESVADSWRALLESNTAWVAVSGETVVGFCVRENATITGLYVDAAARGKGAGKALLDLAKKDRDWIEVWVYEMNTRARAFYRREGFVDVGREKDEHSHLMYIHTRWVRQE